MLHDAIETARRWLDQHASEHLACDRAQMIDRCALHTSEAHDISLRSAHVHAVEAWARGQQSTSGWWLCAERSSHGVIVLCHNDGRLHAVVVDEIAPPDAPPRWIGVDWAAPPG